MQPIIAEEADELLAYAVKNADARDEDSMRSCTPLLIALSTNRDFLPRMVKNRLVNALNGSAMIEKTPQAVLIGSVRSPAGGNFSVRAVIWSPPMTKNPRSIELQDELYSYKTAHDHNFGLLTVGYSGPGYRTRIVSYDREKITGRVGETVSLEPVGDYCLTQGSVLYYRPLKDVHAQFHPERISVSLNLIGHHPDMNSQAQYHFDLEQSKIVSLLPGNIADIEETPFKIIQAIGADEETIGVLEKFAMTHQVEQSRIAAIQTLEKVCGGVSARIIELAKNNNSRLVRQWFEVTNPQ